MNTKLIKLKPTELKDYIDWNFLFVEWDLHGRMPDIFEDPRYGTEAKNLYSDALSMLSELQNDVYALYAKVPAIQKEDDILVDGKYLLPQLRNQTTHFKCISDYVKDEIALFAITTKNIYKTEDVYKSLMSSILCDRLSDAMLTYLEKHIGENPLSICYGYPAAPDHSGKRRIYDLLSLKDNLDLTLTENYSMNPTSSIMGFMVFNEKAEYFVVGKIGEDQIEDYSRRAGLSPDRLKELIPNNI